MIEFKVIIKQTAAGTSFHCETPPGSATMAEQDMGRNFMELVRKFARENHAITTKDWRGANDPKRN